MKKKLNNIHEQTQLDIFNFVLMNFNEKCPPDIKYFSY